MICFASSQFHGRGTRSKKCSVFPTSRTPAELLFDSRAPAFIFPYAGPGVRWRYFGHACILIESQGTSMLFDPVLSYTYESGISRYTYLDLPDQIDYVLITHNHQDHVLFETLLQIRHKVKNIIVPRSGGRLQDPSLKLLLQNCGFRNVIEMSKWKRYGKATFKSPVCLSLASMPTSTLEARWHGW